MPVKNRKLLPQSDVPEKMAGLLVPQPFHVLHHPLPQLEQVSEAGKMGFDVELAILGERSSRLDNILRLTVAEPDIIQLQLNLVSLAFQEKTPLLEPGNCSPASFRRRLRRSRQKQSSAKMSSSLRSRISLNSCRRSWIALRFSL